MPDTAELEMPGSSGSKGVPGWLMVVGAVAGVAGLVLLLKGSGGGGGTTAAGTSINAALGSIQEENMNLLGVTQSGFMQMGQGFDAVNANLAGDFGTLNTGMTTGFLNTQNQIGGLGVQIGSGFSSTQGLLGTLEHDIMSQLTAFSGQTQANFDNMSNLIASGQATQSQVNSAEQSLLQSIQSDVQSGLVGQQQANTLLNQVNRGVWASGGLQNWLTNRSAQLMSVTGMSNTQAIQTATAEWNQGLVRTGTIAFGYPTQ